MRHKPITVTLTSTERVDDGYDVWGIRRENLFFRTVSIGLLILGYTLFVLSTQSLFGNRPGLPVAVGTDDGSSTIIQPSAKDTSPNNAAQPSGETVADSSQQHATPSDNAGSDSVTPASSTHSNVVAGSESENRTPQQTSPQQANKKNPSTDGSSGSTPPSDPPQEQPPQNPEESEPVRDIIRDTGDGADELLGAATDLL